MKHGSSCDSVTPAFFRKCVLKWRRLLRKKRRGHPRTYLCRAGHRDDSPNKSNEVANSLAGNRLGHPRQGFFECAGQRDVCSLTI